MRLQGLLLFLFVPIAFWLLLAQPGDVRVSVAAGAVILATLRFLAAPFEAKTRSIRCIWSGAEIAPGCGYRVHRGGSEETYNSYNDGMRDRAAKLFTFAQKFAWPLRILLIGPIAWYVGAELAGASGVEGIPAHEINVAVLQGGLALFGLVTAIGHLFVEAIPHHARDAVRFPFGIHNVYLLGIRATLCIMFAVSVWWAVEAARFLAQR